LGPNRLVFFGIWAQSSRQVLFERMTIGGLMLVRAAAASAAALQSGRKISSNSCRGMATAAIWKAMLRPWLMTLAPILISFSFRLDSDLSLIGSGVASVRRKLPRL